MLLVILLWFGISAPLSAIGAYFGSKHGVCSFRSAQLIMNILTTIVKAIKHPVRVNPIPRQIPPGPKYLRPWVRF